MGSLRVRLLLRQARSLKDKRQVVRSILDRARHDFNVSAAEVEALDHRQVAVLGFAMVGAAARDVQGALQRLAELLRRHPVAEFLDQELDA